MADLPVASIHSKLRPLSQWNEIIVRVSHYLSTYLSVGMHEDRRLQDVMLDRYAETGSSGSSQSSLSTMSCGVRDADWTV